MRKRNSLEVRVGCMIFDDELDWGDQAPSRKINSLQWVDE